jgi:hypothetical protein
MMECPPLQHIAAVVISHNGELKGPLDLDIGVKLESATLGALARFH